MQVILLCIFYQFDDNETACKSACPHQAYLLALTVAASRFKRVRCAKFGGVDGAE